MAKKFAVHLIMWTRYKNQPTQNEYPVWENVVVLQGDDVDEITRKAELIGKELEGDSGGTQYYGEFPAEHVFGGIRKIIEVSEYSFLDSPATEWDGWEISYSKFLVSSRETLEELIKGEPVDVLYEE